MTESIKHSVYFFTITSKYGGIAQLGERLNGIQEVSGSIPLCSTTPSASVRRRVLEVLIFLHFFLSRLKTI